MKQSQVLKTFMRTWRNELTAAEAEVSNSGGGVAAEQAGARLEVLQNVVQRLESFFEDFQVVKRPPRKGRKSAKVEVAEDSSTVEHTTAAAANTRD